MFARRPPVHELGGIERASTALGFPQPSRHPHGVDVRPQAKVDAGVRCGVQHVIAFVLRVGHSELVLNVFGQGMDLEREIASLHGVEEIEPDGELRAEARMDRFSQKLARVSEHQIDGRNFDLDAAKPEA